MTFTEKTIEEFNEKFSYIDASECEYDLETGKLDSFAIIGREGSMRYGLDAVKDFFKQALAKQKEEILKAFDKADEENLNSSKMLATQFANLREAIEKV